ncbi:MAG: hypothetical protein JWL88_729 [Parcubacteria group bacterium]|nr:hypothetical protein [Parcubacteria group bacterium]
MYEGSIHEHARAFNRKRARFWLSMCILLVIAIILAFCWKAAGIDNSEQLVTIAGVVGIPVAVGCFFSSFSHHCGNPRSRLIWSAVVFAILFSSGMTLHHAMTVNYSSLFANLPL